MPPNFQGTCLRGRCTSPVNPIQIGRLLRGVTPGVSDFGGRARDVSGPPLAPGTRQAPAVTTPGPPLTSLTVPHEHQHFPPLLFFQGETDQGPCCELCRENCDVSRQDFGGPYLRSTSG